ncbi:MAG: hypothetical protein JW832_02360 [Deltaproteobacteria bacterium]|nr:hypothetical protein [Deltaproteobacteria bacterium]
MKMKKHIILGVKVDNRLKHVPQIQKLLSEYGCNIKTRIGLHEVDASSCSVGGLLLLELFGDDQTCMELAGKLVKIKGIVVKKMVFNRD